MESFWTSSKPIKGLRHFTLVNEIKKNGNTFFLMVSVLDSEINLTITYDELINSGNWDKGWLNLPKYESITEEYTDYKLVHKAGGFNKVLINVDSPFNIS